jgi:multidrug efflux pump subunit AcrB
MNQGFSWSQLAIRRHIATLILTIAVAGLGWIFSIQLPVDLLPSITYPRINVILDAPGISPEVAIDEITKPLESALSTTEGVVQVYSQTREGRVSVELYFQPGGNIDQALNDATATLNRARLSLPSSVGQPRIFKLDPTQTPVYEFAVRSPNLSDLELRVFAEQDLARELGLVPGVASVGVAGGLEEEIQVTLDFDRLSSTGIDVDDVLSELRQRNLDVSGGRILGGSREPLSRTVGRLKNVQELENLSFSIPGGSGRVYLREFAQVVDGTKKQRLFVLLNGEPALQMTIQKQPEANTVQVVEGVKSKIKSLRNTGLIPPETEILTTLDDSVFIRGSLSNLLWAGISGSLLAAIAVFFFLGSLRQTLVIALTIPLCALATFILMKAFNLSLNVFSLGGLALGVGQVVDASVVVLENITVGVAKLKQQHILADQPIEISAADCIEQSVTSSQEVESALVASVATNLVSVVPFLLVGGFFSILFNELILTIVFATISSLVVAVTFVPMLTARILGIKWSSRLGEFWLFKQFLRRFEDVTHWYGQSLVHLIRSRILVVTIAFLLLGGASIFMFGQVRQEILPRINTGKAFLFAQFPAETTLADNRKVMDIVNNIFLEQPETEYVFTTVGGFLRSSSNITLKPGSNVQDYVRRVSRLLNDLNLVGIRLRLVPSQVRGIILTNTPVRGAELDVVLASSDERVLAQAGGQLLAALDEQVKTARFRPNGDARQVEIQVQPDWERLSRAGLNARQLGETVQAAIQGVVPTQLQRGNRLVDVRVELKDEAIQQTNQLAQLPVASRNGRIIRVADVANVVEGRAPGEIQRINQQEVFIIAGNLAEGVSFSDAAKDVNRVLEKFELPPGVSILPSSAQATNNQLQSALKLMGALAMFLVFVVMATQYNSLVDPLIIMVTVPLALSGGLFGLYITNTAIGATVLIGVVLLVGIVVNNAIIMIELANQIRVEQGCDRATAILQAAPQRLRPILITSITTVFGLFPLAMGSGEGSEFLQPLGIVVFFGLSVATFLTLFIIPCVYTLVHDLIGSKIIPRRWA